MAKGIHARVLARAGKLVPTMQAFGREGHGREGLNLQRKKMQRGMVGEIGAFHGGFSISARPFVCSRSHEEFSFRMQSD
jgi:hypothetical protein